MLIFLLAIIIISSLDTFILGIYLGLNKIKVKIRTIILINILTAFLLIIAFLIKELIILKINIFIIKYFFFILFLFIGLNKLLDFLIKKDNSININSNILLSVIYLSLDNIIIFFNTNISNNYFLIFLIMHFTIGSLFIYIANYYSYYFINFNKNISSLLSGLLFIFLGFYNLFS